MFTGIVTDIGTVRSVDTRGDTRIVIGCNYDMAGVAIGASIACAGCCLTVIDKGADWFSVDASGETLSKTAPHAWAVGARLNLERALKVGDELGGHIVTGHVDGVGTVIAVDREGDSHRVTVNAPQGLAPYIAAKGSITVDGVSLTVNTVTDNAEGTTFTVNIIPHSWSVTTLGDLVPDRAVNIEIDTLARYLARMRDRSAA
ncbi:MAG: riboflavin synthase [Sphingomonadaceae bacterium]